MAADLGSKRTHGYRFRFGIAYFLLAAVVGAAVGTFVVVMSRSAPKQQAWSAWQPTGDPDQRVAQITAHVSRQYTLSSGNQLVGVVPQEPQVVSQNASQEIRAFGFATPSVTGHERVRFERADGAIEYIFCGLGSKDCSMAEGKPSPERLRMMRREALELALYTFRYVDDIDKVFAMLPPRPGKSPSYGLLFHEDDFAPALKRPLRVTLRQDPPPVPDETSSLDAFTVDQLTRPHFYQFTYQQLTDGGVVLVLAPARL